jgi:crotonobetainyl-CoA:carnitine CoA-transferase CaiB-like acyl-CoA transferase
LHALYRLYQALDGWLCITVESDSQWQALCRAISADELLADARFANPSARLQHDAGLAATLAAIFIQRRTSEWVDLLYSASVPCAPVEQDFLTDFVSDPQSVANGLIAAHQHPTLGTVQVAHRWLRFSQTPIQCRAPAPLLGQHTRQVLLAALGYTGEEIESLRAQQVIRWEG